MTFTAVWAWATGLGISDVCGGWPGWQPYAAVQAGHLLIGMVLARLPHGVASSGVAAWIGKEVLFDLGGCQFGPWVALDSAADLAFAALGAGIASAIASRRSARASP